MDSNNNDNEITNENIVSNEQEKEETVEIITKENTFEVNEENNKTENILKNEEELKREEIARKKKEEQDILFNNLSIQKSKKEDKEFKQISKNKVANVFWIIFIGIWSAVEMAICGVYCMISIINIPVGLVMFKSIPLVFAPFNKRVLTNPGKNIVLNILWLIFGGFIIASLYSILTFIVRLTIIGIPISIQMSKMRKLLWFPIGATITSIDQFGNENERNYVHVIKLFNNKFHYQKYSMNNGYKVLNKKNEDKKITYNMDKNSPEYAHIIELNNSMYKRNTKIYKIYKILLFLIWLTLISFIVLSNIFYRDIFHNSLYSYVNLAFEYVINSIGHLVKTLLNTFFVNAFDITFNSFWSYIKFILEDSGFQSTTFIDAFPIVVVFTIINLIIIYLIINKKINTNNQKRDMWGFMTDKELLKEYSNVTSLLFISKKGKAEFDEFYSIIYNSNKEEIEIMNQKDRYQLVKSDNIH